MAQKQDRTDDRDSITCLWSDWHSHRKECNKTVAEIARGLNSNRSTIYELGKVNSKTRQFQGEDFLRAALAIVQISDDEALNWVGRYHRLEAATREGNRAARPRTFHWRTAAAVAALTAVITVICTLYFVQAFSPPDRTAPGMPTVIEVQNMIAIGPAGLVEDSTPAYLSLRPESYCANSGKNCKIPGTDMSSGALLVAVCQATGDEIVNYDEEKGDPSNPSRFKSSRWYGIELYDKRIGFIAETYIRDHDRGGRSLPSCGPQNPLLR